MSELIQNGAELSESNAENQNSSTPLSNEKIAEAGRTGIFDQLTRGRKINRHINYALPHPQLKEMHDYPTEDAVYAQQESSLFLALKNHLPQGHPTVQFLTESVNSLLEVAQLPRGSFKVVLYGGYHPDVHVSVPTREIRISDTLLFEVFEGNEDLFLSVAAHEIGHVLLAQYSDGVIARGGGDPVRNHVLYYEEEYQSDRIASILLNRLNYSPDLLAEALKRIHKFYECKEKSKDKKSQGQAIIRKKNHLWLINIHILLFHGA